MRRCASEENLVLLPPTKSGPGSRVQAQCVKRSLPRRRRFPARLGVRRVRPARPRSPRSPPT